LKALGASKQLISSKRTMLEADSKTRQRKKPSTNRRTTGLLNLLISIKRLKPAKKEYLKKKPNID